MKSVKAIKTYIVSAISFDGTTTEKEKITELMRRFNSEYWYPDNQKRYNYNVIKAIASWLQGLPSEVNIAFDYNEIDHLLIEWKYIKETSKETTVTRERENYWLYIANMIVILAKQHNVA